MLKKALTYGAGLIAVYLLVANANGTGTVFSKGGTAVSGLVKTLQGR